MAVTFLAAGFVNEAVFVKEVDLVDEAGFIDEADFVDEAGFVNEADLFCADGFLTADFFGAVVGTAFGRAFATVFFSGFALGLDAVDFVLMIVLSLVNSSRYFMGLSCS
ncbi:MAG TPA: hypothetical protein VGM92_01650 [Candidatus Kapabacteria bacterium]